MDETEPLISPEQKLEAFMSATCEEMIILGSDMRVLWANQAVESWACGAGKIKGSLCYEVYRKRNAICEGCPAIKAFRTGNVEKTIEPPCAPKGAVKHSILTASPILDKNGDTAAVAVVVHYFTKDLELDNKVKEISDELRAIIDGIGDGISIIDRDFNIVRVNRAVLDIFRKSDFKEVLGKKCYQEYYRRHEPCNGCPAHRTFSEGLRSHSANIWRHGKEKKILEVFTFPIGNGGGAATVIECFRDITGTINLEDQLLHSERLAGIGELAAGVAHEIRNPLSIITSSIQLCLKKYDIDEAVKRHLETILRNAENANSIISDLLDFARPSDVPLKLGNINEVIERVCNLVQSRCEKQSVRLRAKMHKPMPEMEIDEKRLESSFMNFVLNSLDAMPSEGDLTIVTSHDRAKDEITVRIKDTGEGIPPENVDKIFNPFFTTKRRGTGLGLSIAHNVIVCHKGSIDVASDPGIGTEIAVRFPVFKNKAGV